ncbi:hypothetical protein PHLGIDRAFT_17724 [Phlebiopsis gigantea 11061_1 CR5-6]|uniref:S5 DRBM domain-containing protein n=1 Tax=Phlebiopsis gigantea (strain 11061_1 CR5-6) TaxID=745531 RepID=A0A0C3SDR5_PHLG1|nr:hypothetical protein PHLGIDRAFT_17724 [Phlebiopsis gigantea 11061_1 CR5-6]
MLRLTKHAFNNFRPLQSSLPAMRARVLSVTSIRCNSSLPPTPTDISSSAHEFESDLLEEVEEDFEEEAEVQETFRWPNLMERDPILDDVEITNFGTSKQSPYSNSVTWRNKEDPKDADRESNSQFPEDRDDAKPYLLSTTRPSLISHRYVLVRKRVTQQTGKGKMHSQAILVVVGNGNGLVGYGYTTHPTDLAYAISKATEEAIRSMDRVDRFENRTVWSEMESKFSSTRIILRPRPVGFGLRCNPYIHQICKAAGIKDISAKVWGSKRPTQVIHCAIRMLQGGNAPLAMGNGFGGPGKRTAAGVGMRGAADIERERGRRIVPLRA